MKQDEDDGHHETHESKNFMRHDDLQESYAAR
jgi:hypothetical protein